MESLPEVGGEYVYCGVNVRVTGVRKLGRGWQVQYDWISGSRGWHCRLRDWRKGVQ